MSKYLIFQPSIEGHYLEYLHHEYIAAGQKDYSSFVFVVPEILKNNQLDLSWPSYRNVKLCYLSSDEYIKCNQTSFIKRSWAQSSTIRKYCRMYGATTCFLNNLVNSMPLLPFFLPKGCKASGIIYGIYRWNEDQMSTFRILFNKLLYRLYSIQSKFKKIYLLNDKVSPEYFNQLFNTSTFAYLPDPINISEKYHPHEELRATLGINDHDLVYLLLGVQQRKHPFEILEAIRSMSKEQLSNKVFIFAGVIQESIRDQFFSEIDSLKGKAKFILKTGRVPFETIYDLFFVSNYCFVLYDNTNMSSGVLGYAASFRSKVIGVSHGLLGHIIEDYQLGVCINNIDAQEIKSILIDTSDNQLFNSCYVKANTIEKFVTKIMSNL